MVEDYTPKDLYTETHYLNNTIAPNLNIKHRIDVDPVTKKYKMISVNAEQLKNILKTLLDTFHSKDTATLMRGVIFE